MFILFSKRNEQLFEKLYNKSNNLIIMGDFNAKYFNLGSERTNHNENKSMNTLRRYNLFVAQSNTRYNHLRNKICTIDYIIISPSVIANISNVNFEFDIPSDHCIMTLILKLEKMRSDSRKISLQLYRKVNWQKINENIKNKL